ncbi:MAG TPA: hypothetical protein VNF49_07645, partial [Candidatus Binataceae bacterium]|nr:hypothetical protein [Candidatus Binataceae bacterium]
FWATFIFFTLSGSRRSYYLLPILPAGALLVARMLTTPAEALSPLERRLMKLGWAVIAIGVIGGVIVMLPPTWILRGRLAALPPAPDRIIYAVCWTISLLAVIYALGRFESRRVAMATATAGFMFLAYLFIFAMPAADKWRGEKSFAAAIRQRMGPATSGVVLYRAEGPLFYLAMPHPLPYYDDVGKLREDALANKVHWVIVRRRDINSLESRIGLPAKVVAHEAFFPFEPRQHVLNKEALVVLGKPAAAGRNGERSTTLTAASASRHR